MTSDAGSAGNVPGTKPTISFIGLGAMGFGMATHLVNQGYKVIGFDVYGPTLERFTAAGGRAGSTAAEAAKGSSYCICMVATAQQAQSVLLDAPSSAINALAKGATLLLCSTTPCQYVQGLQAKVLEIGRSDIYLVDCPVSGGAYRAADGTLSIMAGASDEAIAKGLFLLRALSDPQKLYIVQGGIGAGSNMKMCHQVLAANQILAASEAMGFAKHLGLDLQKVGDAIVESDAFSWMFNHRLPRMLHPEFQPIVSALTIITKDTSIITSEARRYSFPTPMTSTAEQVYFTAIGRGYGQDDDSGMLRLYTEGTNNAAILASSEAEKLGLIQGLLRGIHLCSAAETLAFSHYLKLDLDQVLELCVTAAGGSSILDSIGQDIIKTLRNGIPPPISPDGYSLQKIAGDLQQAMELAQLLKAPLLLGSQALNIIRLVQQHGPKGGDEPTAAAAVVKMWAL